MLHNIIISGFGGQGVMAMGKTLAEAGMKEGVNVSWLPSYGPEMRAGHFPCSARCERADRHEQAVACEV